MSQSRSCLLISHSTTPIPQVTRFEVEAVRSGGELQLTYTLEGDIASLLVPISGARERKDLLWHHLCFEAFVMAGEGPGYIEFNLSPSGDWAAYRFSSFREGMADLTEIEQVESHTVREERFLSLSVTLPIGLVPGFAQADWSLGLTTVVEDREGNLSFWALCHPGEQPEFHRADGFICELPHEGS